MPSIAHLQFVASTRAVVHKLTDDNVGKGKHAGQPSRVRITRKCPAGWQPLVLSEIENAPALHYLTFCLRVIQHRLLRCISLGAA